MKVNKKSRSFLFLIEMLIAVVFFSISSLVCVQLFVKAKQRNDDANNTSMAAIIATNVVEQLKVEKDYPASSVVDGFDVTVQLDEKALYTDVHLCISKDEVVFLELDTSYLKETAYEK